MENENTILSENDKLALAFKAGARSLEAIIDNTDSCVNVENVINPFNAEENIFKFQHKSGRVYHLQQQLYSHDDGSTRYQIVWGLVTCSMNGTLYNLTNLRRHRWFDWLSDKSITDDRQQYLWFRFHGKCLSADDCSMIVNVYDDGHVTVEQTYDIDYIIGKLLSDTSHLANNIMQKDLKSDSNYISGNHKRKQMMDVINSVIAIEGPAECIVKAFNPDIFKLRQTVAENDTVLFDEINVAKVTLNFEAVLPAFEDRVAFCFEYKMTINTQDYTAKCNDTQEICLFIQKADFEVTQTYKGTMPFTLQFNLIPNKEKYTNSRWCDYQQMKLGDIGDINPSTGKSAIQEFTDGYLSMNPIIDAVKSVC